MVFGSKSCHIPIRELLKTASRQGSKILFRKLWIWKQAQHGDQTSDNAPMGHALCTKNKLKFRMRGKL
jgi:hypothetical protein